TESHEAKIRSTSPSEGNEEKSHAGGPNTADATGDNSGSASIAPPTAASNSRRPVVTVIRPSRARVRKGNDTMPHACSLHVQGGQSQLPRCVRRRHVPKFANWSSCPLLLRSLSNFGSAAKRRGVPKGDINAALRIASWVAPGPSETRFPASSYSMYPMSEAPVG